ncbi:MAG: energy-coupling factor transporter transmembrane protein EcfT, partial [Propionibacteriaceae bacterium]|nr:energy-coupling factor transporter transmembrane protein EcfT [Propionibacteriaceae bacterium]
MGAFTLYQPGTSWLHRWHPGVKLAGLVVWTVAVVAAQRWLPVLAVLGALVVAVFLVTGLGWRLLWHQVRPMLIFVGLLAVMHLIGRAWHNAIAVPATIVLLVLGAALVTLTTPAAAMVEVVTRASAPLRHIGVDPARVGLVVLLGLRCVPLMSALASRVRQAQIARAGVFDLRAFAVPLIVAALRQAEATGEALVA